jgi:hypothetical protein
MTVNIEEVLAMPDPALVLDSISEYEATSLIAFLRRAENIDLDRRVSYRIAEALHQRQPDNVVVTTVFAALLKDIGEVRRAAEVLAVRLRQDCDWYFLRVVGSVLWRMDYQTSAQLAFELADQYEDAGRGNYAITNETLESLRARLRRTWLPDNVFYRLSEEGKQPFITSSELQQMESPVEIHGLTGYTLRPLKSKRQLARVANQLQNCLNSYLSQVVHGTTLLFAVEFHGTPVEAIEVNPATRRVVQWKGKRNSAPNQRTHTAIQQTLTQISRVAAPAIS